MTHIEIKALLGIHLRARLPVGEELYRRAKNAIIKARLTGNLEQAAFLSQVKQIARKQIAKKSPSKHLRCRQCGEPCHGLYCVIHAYKSRHMRGLRKLGPEIPKLKKHRWNSTTPLCEICRVALFSPRAKRCKKHRYFVDTSPASSQGTGDSMNARYIRQLSAD